MQKPRLHQTGPTREGLNPPLGPRGTGGALLVGRSWPPVAGSGSLVSGRDAGLLSQGLGEREIRCDAGAALATVIGKSGSGPRGQPLGPHGPGKAEHGRVVPVSQETGQGASSIHEVLERVC